MEQRKSKRFTLQLPFALTRSGNRGLSAAGLTQNISSSGVLFTAAREFDVGGAIEYVITLTDGSRNLVNVKCAGKVVRQARIGGESDDRERPVTVAATMERYEFVRFRED